jgi:ABC-2 type transport system ATP-binding protein
MSSHDLSEVERICERVAVVRDGRLVAEETIANLKRRHRRSAAVTFAGAVPEGLSRVAHVSVVERRGERIELAIDGDVVPLLRFLATQDVVDLLLPPPRLDDIFLDFYGQTGDDSSRSGDGSAAGLVHPRETQGVAAEMVARR